MNILHLTDFHFSTKSSDKYRQSKIVNKIIDDIEANKFKPDFIFFTGDLVDKGESIENFKLAKAELIDNLLNRLGMPIESFFICPGNHDVNQSRVSLATFEYIDKIVDNNKLDSFAVSSNFDFLNSLEPLANYFEFTDGLFINTDDDYLYEKGFSCHLRNLNGAKVGIMCANTAWRSIGKLDTSSGPKYDTGNLLIPLKFLKQGLEFLSKCDFKILLHHHPISDFRGFNKYELEDLIHNNFNISFSGHVHKDSTSAFYTNNAGILQLEAAATLAESDGSTIGYTFLEVDAEEATAICTSRYYDERREFLYDNGKRNIPIPISQGKQEQNRFRRKLRQRFDSELENANDLFLHGKQERGVKGFNDLWTSPVLSLKSAEEVRRGDFATHSFDFNNLINDSKDYLILGKDKCGKTSLLKKIQLECLQTYTKIKLVPYYINAKSYAFNETNYKDKLQRDIATYYGTNRVDADNIIEQKNLLLLIDNIDLSNSHTAVWLQQVLTAYPNVRIIVCTDDTSDNKYKDLLIHGRKVTKIFFHTLKKKQIKELAHKLYGDTEDKIEIVKKISDIFTMLAIPFDFWSVSLFMWVFKESSTSIQNDVGLIDLYIESILEREKLVKNKISFGFENYKLYLANLAKFLLIKRDDFYSASYTEIINFTNDYLSKNPRNDVDSRKVWEYVELKGIVKQNTDLKYTFRLNGIFEYFLSYYMKNDSNFRNEIIEDNFAYLGFKNEMEMYAGSNRRDEEFLIKIYKKTKEIFASVQAEFADVNIESAIQSLTCNPNDDLIKQGASEFKRLSEEERDEMEEDSISSSLLLADRNCEVRVKDAVELDGNDISSLEKSLYILGRVFKNADQIDNVNLINEIFDYLLDSTCKWGLKMFQALKLAETENEGIKSQHEALLQLMQQMLPVIVESRIYDMIGASNMQNIIKNKIKEIKKDKNEIQKNQFKLFILFYLLSDIDLRKNIDYISDSLDLIKTPILKYAIVLKILYYMHFKIDELPATLKKDMESKLKNIYAKAQNNFTGKGSGDNISRSVSDINKKRLIRRMKNK